MVSMSMIRSGLCILFAGALLCAPAAAQWRVAQESPAGSGKRIDVAVIENDSGHNLRLFNDDVLNVRGVFTIRDGFDSIDPAVCPTYRVDEREPKRVRFEEKRCRVQAKHAEFTLGNSRDIENRDLRRIMNGSSVVFRYRLSGGNYRETKFTLRGSKYALTTALEDFYLGFDE